MQESHLHALDALMYQMEVAAEAARMKLTTMGPAFRIFSVWLLRLADALQVRPLAGRRTQDWHVTVRAPTCVRERAM